MKSRNLFLLVISSMVFFGATSLAQQIRQDVGTQLLIPSSAKIAGFTSFLAIENLDTQPNIVKIDARNTNGVQLGEKTTTIPVGGRFRSADILSELGINGDAFGPISIESTNGRVLTAVSEVTSTDGPGGFFPGVNTQTAWQQGYILEVIDTGSKGGPQKTYRTNIGVNNVGSVTANVTVTLHDNFGTQVGIPIQFVVAPNGMTQKNNIVRDLLQSGGAVTGQNGYLKITSDKPVIAWASKVENGSEDPSFQIAVGAASTVASQTQLGVTDFRNNFLFLTFAFAGTAILLRRQRKHSPDGFSQGTIVGETA